MHTLEAQDGGARSFVKGGVIRARTVEGSHYICIIEDVDHEVGPQKFSVQFLHNGTFRTVDRNDVEKMALGDACKLSAEQEPLWPCEESALPQHSGGEAMGKERNTEVYVIGEENKSDYNNTNQKDNRNEAKHPVSVSVPGGGRQDTQQADGTRVKVEPVDQDAWGANQQDGERSEMAAKEPMLRVM